MYPIIPYISIINYNLEVDKTDFENAFYFPEAENKQDFLDYFLMEYGEFTPLYQKPEMLLKHIQVVSNSLKYTIDKLYATLSLEYNPIENYDRHENIIDETERAGEQETTKNGTLTYSGGETTTYAGGESTTYAGGESTTYSGSVTNSITGSETESTPSRQIEHQVSADNTGTYFPHQLDVEGASSTSKSFTDRADTSTFNNRVDSRQFNGRTDTQQYNNRSDSKQYNNRYDVNQETLRDENNGTESVTHTGRIHGNIGVMTTQAMIEEERRVALFNFIDFVAGLYAEKLLILIY